MMEKKQPVSRERQSFVIRNADQEDFTLSLKGRSYWLLSILRLSGPKGVTTAELPAGVRFSSALHILRGKGVEVLTTMEPHGGAYAGQHGRYTLISSVHPVFDPMAPAISLPKTEGESII